MRFLITAGPTREPIDSIRYLSNRSSGKMGYALAEAAVAADHEVVLISGPVDLEPVAGATLIAVSTSDEMFDAVVWHAKSCDVLIMAAAVADYKPARVSPIKIKKRDANLALQLIPTRDILATIGKQQRNYLLAGFAAETENLEANAEKKLREKNLDLIIANDVSDPAIGMESGENEVIVLFRSGEKRKIERATKRDIARELVKISVNTREKCLTKKM